MPLDVHIKVTLIALHSLRTLTFKELMLIAMQGVDFSFSSQIYTQLDRVAMGSPLGLALVNFFVGIHESRIFNTTVKPGVYFQYVDDTFLTFGSELDCDHFHEHLNLLIQALKFRVETEQNNSLNFLDVLVEKGGHWISFLHLQENNLYWTIHPLEFLKPKKKKN